jgi:ligand-binding SRPBCC domain-containing protein
MSTIRKSVRIEAPVEAVYDFVTHPENLVEIWPSMVEVKNVTRSADGAHSFDWTYKMAGVKFRGHAVTEKAEPYRRNVTVNEKGIPSRFTWTYDATARDQTMVTMEVEYTTPNRILKALAEPFVNRMNEREAETVLANLKSRLELSAPALIAKGVPTAHVIH